MCFIVIQAIRLIIDFIIGVIGAEAEEYIAFIHLIALAHIN